MRTKRALPIRAQLVRRLLRLEVEHAELLTRAVAAERCTRPARPAGVLRGPLQAVQLIGRPVTEQAAEGAIGRLNPHPAVPRKAKPLELSRRAVIVRKSQGAVEALWHSGERVVLAVEAEEKSRERAVARDTQPEPIVYQGQVQAQRNGSQSGISAKAGRGRATFRVDSEDAREGIAVLRREAAG